MAFTSGSFLRNSYLPTFKLEHIKHVNKLTPSQTVITSLKSISGFNVSYNFSTCGFYTFIDE